MHEYRVIPYEFANRKNKCISILMKTWWLKVLKKQTPKPVSKGRISPPFGFYRHLKFKLWPAITFFLYKIFECFFFLCSSFDILYIISKNQHSNYNRKKVEKFAEKLTLRAFPVKTTLLMCPEKKRLESDAYGLSKLQITEKMSFSFACN